MITVESIPLGTTNCVYGFQTTVSSPVWNELKLRLQKSPRTVTPEHFREAHTRCQHLDARCVEAGGHRHGGFETQRRHCVLGFLLPWPSSVGRNKSANPKCTLKCLIRNNTLWGEYVFVTIWCVILWRNDRTHARRASGCVFETRWRYIFSIVVIW